MNEQASGAVSIATIKAVIRAEYRLPENAMETAQRPNRIARPRQLAMYLAREMTCFSLPTIGRNFGNRDHTTVMHACRKVEQRLETSAFRAHVEGLMQRIASATEGGDSIPDPPRLFYDPCQTAACGKPRMRGSLYCRDCQH